MTRHEALVREYAKELRAAKTRAERWWINLGKSLVSQTSDAKAAEQILRDRWPDGPASHPWVLAVIRKYWLACDALNEQLARDQPAEIERSPDEYVLADEDEDEEDDEDEEVEAEEEDEVYPHIFVLEWLMTDEFDDLAVFLGSLSFWPVGLDSEDRYT